MTTIHEYRCGCCGRVLTVSSRNLRRLVEAATFAYGGVPVVIRMDLMPAADWTDDELPDELIGRAVVAAFAPDDAHLVQL